MECERERERVRVREGKRVREGCGGGDIESISSCGLEYECYLKFGFWGQLCNLIKIVR